MSHFEGGITLQELITVPISDRNALHSVAPARKEPLCSPGIFLLQPLAFSRWPSAAGLQPLAFSRWPSAAGLQPLAQIAFGTCCRGSL
jgi:hypothetical protein